MESEVQKEVGGSGMGRSQNVPIAAFDTKMALAGNSPDSLAFGRPRKRKETRGELGVSEINAAFSSDYRSGETGMRTLGTLAGTPVFKTGAGVTLLVCQTSQ